MCHCVRPLSPDGSLKFHSCCKGEIPYCPNRDENYPVSSALDANFPLNSDSSPKLIFHHQPSEQSPGVMNNEAEQPLDLSRNGKKRTLSGDIWVPVIFKRTKNCAEATPKSGSKSVIVVRIGDGNLDAMFEKTLCKKTQDCDTGTREAEQKVVNLRSKKRYSSFALLGFVPDSKVVIIEDSTVSGEFYYFCETSLSCYFTGEFAYY